jgi:membrane fusion protein, multidrug efflux system
MLTARLSRKILTPPKLSYRVWQIGLTPPWELPRLPEFIAKRLIYLGRTPDSAQVRLIRTGPRDPRVEIVLNDDQNVNAVGHVREVAPEADSASRTYRVKVGIENPPEALRLGATVTGSIRLSAPPGIEIPATALTEADGRPAVWVVDPQSHAVSLRSVEVRRHDPDAVVISKGLEKGEVVVTAGAQTLRPGRKVRLLGAVL